MLQNMQQGIFTILSGQVIHPEHSAYLQQIFETGNVANRPALSFLFDQSDVGSDMLSQMSAALDSMIGEDGMMFGIQFAFAGFGIYEILCRWPFQDHGARLEFGAGCRWGNRQDNGNGARCNRT